MVKLKPLDQWKKVKVKFVAGKMKRGEKDVPPSSEGH